MGDVVANDELFVKVLAQIEREPEKWDQGVFSPDASACGTAMCFAGWACVLGGRPVGLASRTVDGEFIPQAAQELLEFDREHWNHSVGYIFSSEHSLNDLYRISAWITGLDETVLRDKVRSELCA